MIRKNLIKTSLITMAVLTLAFGMTACGKKNNTVKDNNTTAAAEAVTTVDKNNTKKPSKVVFDYTDADGVTTKLEGNATVSDNGEAVIEVIDNNGNKAVFTGKASIDNGKLSVSDIKVKNASTLVKTDGTEVKVSEGAKIEDAAESTEETKADIAAKEEPKGDTIVADGGNTDSNVSEGTGNEAAPDNTPDYSKPAPEPQPEVPDYNEPDNSDNNDTGNTDNGSSNTGNSFYDDYMNGGHMKGDEDLIDKDRLKEIRTKLAEINVKNVAKELEVGEMTLQDIVQELSKPGRDPREEMPKPILRADVLKFEDLKEGMVLTGTVRNVTDFGAFVDIGVKHDGLVHISQLSNNFVKNPSDVVSVGDIVKVKVIGIDLERQKVQLSMREV